MKNGTLFLLNHLLPVSNNTGVTCSAAGAMANLQKFFASFFQKRRSFFPQNSSESNFARLAISRVAARSALEK
jgi:hypothetical protein